MKADWKDIVIVGIVAVFLLCLAWMLRGCDMHLQEEFTKREAIKAGVCPEVKP